MSPLAPARLHDMAFWAVLALVLYLESKLFLGWGFADQAQQRAWLEGTGLALGATAIWGTIGWLVALASIRTAPDRQMRRRDWLRAAALLAAWLVPLALIFLR